MKPSIRSLLCVALVCALAPSLAHAEADGRAALFPDSAVVASVRLAALATAMQRAGSGWEKLVRRVLPLPPAVSPFEPAVLATTGIAPDRTAWIGLRALRGGVHARATIPLVEARVADALLQSGARGLGIELVRGARGDWGGRTRTGEVVLARLDGDTVVIDLVFPGPTASPTPADLARIVPLRPPRGWRGDRGVARRMGPSDAVALWTDLILAPKLALLRSEQQLSLALKSVDPKMKAQLARAGRDEITGCQHALDDVAATFDDARVALVVRSPDELGFEMSLGGRRAAIDKLRISSTRPATRAFGEIGADAAVRLELHGPLPLLVPEPSSARARGELPLVCPGPARAAFLLRAWPTLRWGNASLVQALASLRGGIAAMAAPTDGGPLDPRQLVFVVELEMAARGMLDKLFADSWSPSAPLRVNDRQLETLSPKLAGWEGAVWAIDSSAAGALLAFGRRESLRAVLEHLAPAPAAGRGPLLSARISESGLGGMLRTAGAELAAMLDRVGRVDAALALDDELVRLEATLALKK